jgi:hypothetical protein
VAKEKLGIASPSKVFAEIGEYIMQGMAGGINRAAMQPAYSMAQAANMMAHGAVTNRSFTANFGGVTIANRMDDIWFEARVRQIMEASV